MDARLLLRCVLLFCGALLCHHTVSAACDGTAPAPGSHTLDVEGARRSLLLRLPAGYDGTTPAPVVVTFHPFGMNAQYMQSRVSASRTWSEAITVHAEAGGAPPAWQSAPETAANRDLRYFDRLVVWLETEACIDRSRLFVLGYSNGAQFAALLACVRPDTITAAAAAAGRLPCDPPRATPVILSHGLADRTIPYTEALAASRAWSDVNRCTAPPSGGSPGCAAAEACALAPVTMCTYAGGHEYDASFTARAITFFRDVTVR